MKSRRTSIICLGALLVAGTVVVLRPHHGPPPEASAEKARSGRGGDGIKPLEKPGDGIKEASSMDAAEITDPESVQDFGAWTREAPRDPDFAKIKAFDDWAARWQKATPEERLALVEEGRALAADRRPEFKALIATDPRLALTTTIDPLIRQDLPREIDALLEKRVNAKGNYDVYNAINQDGPAPEPTIRYFEADGVSYQAYVFGGMQSVMSRKDIPLAGVAVDRPFAVAESPVYQYKVGERIPAGVTVQDTCPVSGETTEAVSSGEPVVEATPTIEVGGELITLCNGAHVTVLDEKYKTLVQAAGPGGGAFFMDSFPGTSSKAIGNFRILYIRATYPDQMSPPNTEDVANDDLRNTTRYYLESSYGKMTTTYTVTSLITLPQTLKWYQDKDLEVNGLGVLQTQARAEARKLGYDSTQYDCIVLRVNGGLRSGSSWGGGDSVWLGWGGMDVMNHECGHSLGRSHANYWSTNDGTAYGNGENQEYGNGFDVMGGGGGFSAHYNIFSKRALGWLPDSYINFPKTNGTYRIHAYDQPQLEEGKRYGLMVPKDSVRGYNVEYHPARGGKLADSAVVIYSGMGSNAGHLVDTTPGSTGGKGDGGIAVGRTYSDLESDQHFTVVAKNATSPPSLDVTYNRGPFPGNVAPTATLATTGTTIAVGGSVTFTATAADANGDTLAYYWQFDDGVDGSNGPVFTRSFPVAAQVTAMLTVSDMKGGSVRRSVVINVGSHGKQVVTGTVTSGGSPLAGAYVSNGTRATYTDADGSYSLSGLGTGANTLTATLPGYTFTPSTANPYTVVAGTNTVNWTAVGSAFVTLTRTADSTEGGTNGNFRLTRTGDASAALDVTVAPVGGTAVKTTDYTFAPDYVTSGSYRTFTLPAGSATLDVAVAAVNDTAAEGPETITLQIVSGPGYTTSTANSVVMNLIDNDTTLPQVVVTAPDPYATENGDGASFTFTRTGSTAAALNLTVAWSGAATNGTDYTTLPTTVTIPSGQSSVNVAVASINDSAIEGPEDIIATISTAATYVRDAALTTATVALTDDDSPVVTVSVPDPGASEAGPASGVFLINRTGSTTAPLTVYYGLSGTAFHGNDYAALDGQVVIPAGATSAPVVIQPYDDNYGEQTETVTLAVTTFDNGYSLGSDFQGTVNIADNNDAPTVSVRSGTVGVEGGANATFIFHSTGTGSGNVTVNYTVGGTATPGADYTALSGSVSVPVNGSNDTTVTIPIIGDTIAEPTETVVVTLTPGGGCCILNDATATAQIRDNDSGDRVMVSAFNSSASEAGSANGQFYISRPTTVGDLTVSYTLGGTATNGTDYASLSGTAIIPDTASGVVVTVTPVDDAIAEGTETVTMNLVAATGYGVDLSGSATLEIADNDISSVTVGFQQTSITTTEQPGGFGEFRDIPVILSAASASTITVQVVGGAGSSAIGNDGDWAFADAANGNAIIPSATLAFAPGTTTRNVRIRVANDGIAEGTETIVLELRAPSNASLTANRSKANILVFDDALPDLVTEERWNGSTVYTNNTWSSVSPDYTGYLIGFTPQQGVADNYSRRLTGIVTAPTTGTYNFWIASDDASRLYVSTTSSAANKVQVATVSGYTGFQAWDTQAGQKSANLTLTAGQTYYVEVQHQEGGGGDHVSVAWQGPSFARTPLAFDVPDTAPRTVRMLAAATTRVEVDGSEPQLQVVLDRPAGTSAITVNYSSSGTATNGSDYSLTAGTLTFASGEQMKSLPLTLLPDALEEGPETIIVSLSSPSGAALKTPSTHVITLNDTNGPEVFGASLSVNSAMPAATVLGSLTATPVSGRSIAGWSIVAGNPGGVFGISGAGQITLQSPGLLTAPGTAYSLTVRATDNLGAAGEATVTVAVKNTDGIWVNASGGPWTTTGNWSSGLIATGPNATADFSTLDLPANTTVTLGADRTIGNLVFDDTGATGDSAWTLSGSTLTLAGTSPTVETRTSATIGSVIAGTNPLVKTGDAALTLTGTNTFTGGIEVRNGRLNVSGASSLGTGTILANSSYGGSYSSGGTPFLAVTSTGAVTVANAIVLPDSGASRYYAIQKSGSSSTLTLSGTISGGGANTVLQLDSPTGGDSTTAYTLSGNNSFAGLIRLNRGRFSLTNANAAGRAAILLQSNSNSAGNLIFTSSFSFPNRITIATSGNTISTEANEVVLSGTVSSSVPWNKAGTGTLVLTGDNGITGSTNINAGTLAGTSNLNGPTTIAAGARLAPGVGGIGTMTITDSLTLVGTSEMQIGRTGSTAACDKVAGMSAVTFGGTLTVTDAGPDPLVAGDSFLLFSAAAYSGNFSTVTLPSLPSGLVWDSTHLADSGTIVVGALPLASDDSVTLAEDTAATVNVLANDSDPDGDTLTLLSVTPGAHGSAVISGGSVIYTPEPNFNGADSFTYTVTDSSDGTDTATVSVVVTPVNDSPAFTTNPIAGAPATEDSAYSGSIAASGSDIDAGDVLSYSKVSGPSWLAVASNGALSGTPLNEHVGANAFVVRITDTAGQTDTATLNVIVANTNDAPTFTSNPIVVVDATQDVPYSGSISGYGSDADVGDTLSYSKVSGASWLTVASNGSLSGTPTSSDGGLNTFSVKLTDASGANVSASLNIQVVVLDSNGVFANLTGGNWSAGANWVSGTIANGSGKTADFSTLDLTANATVTVDGARTIGNLSFNDTGASADSTWTLAGSTLTLAGGTTSTVATDTAAVFNNVLAGSNSLTKTGTAALTLGGANILTGGIVVQQGKLNANSAAALGSGAITGNSSYGASYSSGGNPFLAITATGATTVPNNIVIPNPGTTSYYAIQKLGVGSSLTLGGTISGGGTNSILQLDSPTSGDATTNITLSGSNTLAGQLRLNRGTLTLTNANAAGTAALLIQTNANAAGNLIFTNSFTLTNRITITTGGDTITTGTHDVVLSGIVTSGVAWGKIGTGKLTLTGSNAISGTSNINAGTLAGTSSFGGPVTIAAAATLAPGVSGIATQTMSSTLSLAGTTRMELSKSGTTLSNDKITGLTTVTYGGALIVTDIGSAAFADGDSFQLFSATTRSGAFTSYTLPTLNANLAWDTGRLTVDGTLAVVALPAGWISADIGSVGTAGSTGYVSGTGTYTVSGAGADIGGTADAFRFASTSLTGDGEIRARVTSQTNTGAWAEAGVMMRDGTAAGAAHTLMAATPGNGLSNQYRATASASSVNAGGIALNPVPNNWVRITRSGSLFTTYASADGTTWTQVAQQTITMASTINVGLVVNSTSTAVVSTATFDNVAVTPYPSPWLTTDLGTTGPAGRSEYYNAIHTLHGAGVIGGTADGFRFTYQILSGDGDITARIPSFANTGTSSRIGVMMRDTLTAGSNFVFLGTNGAGAFSWNSRTTTGGTVSTATSGTAAAPNVWVRLVRSGTSVTVYSSVNGTSWTTVGTTTVTMASNCYIGLATGSGGTTTLNASTFDNISVTP